MGLWVWKFALENFRKFILIFPEIYGNLLNIYFHLYVLIIIMFPTPALQSDAVKSAFFTNNSHALTLCIVVKKK